MMMVIIIIINSFLIDERMGPSIQTRNLNHHVSNSCLNKIHSWNCLLASLSGARQILSKAQPVSYTKVYWNAKSSVV
jgi:hypothetical protein